MVNAKFSKWRQNLLSLWEVRNGWKLVWIDKVYYLDGKEIKVGEVLQIN